MTHLFLSPHPDDVALSCGGFVYELVQRGEDVHVLTLMSQNPSPAVLDKPFIQQLHRRWRLGDAPYTVRQAEDRNALQALGVEKVLFGPWHDAIYRADAGGKLLYTGDDDIFGIIKSDDPLNTAEIDFSVWQNLTHVYSPLGAGNHVDHQIVRDAVLRSIPDGVTLGFYEEYPYSAESTEVYHAHEGETERLFGTQAVQLALRKIAQTITPQVEELSISALNAKIAAITMYESQLSSFWKSIDDMRQSVASYAAIIGNLIDRAYGERIWYTNHQKLR